MKRQVIEGIIQGNERGYAFLLPIDTDYEDFFIPHGELKGALHKDRVLAEATYGKGERTTARVLKIIERGCSEIVGTYFSSRHGGFVVADDKKFSTDVFVPFGKGLRANSGDKVVCKIIAYPHRKNPEGLVKEILGRQFSRNAELKSIQRTYSLEDSFPNKVLKQVDLLTTPTTTDFENRQDFRKECIFTIDGDDSRDFDDAVSIAKYQDGYRLGVHIADVSHYVKQGDVIDMEAYKRGTSVYFPESVIPMLPEKLCNDICSLKQGEDRLTLSCLIDLDLQGNVKDYKICESIICSKARTTYFEIQKLIDGDKQVLEKYQEIKDSVLLMSELADVLIKKRELQGYVNLDVKESKITVDNKGMISVDSTSSDKAHKLIEEFMILANVCVAKKMFDLQIPCAYRVHERPDEQKYRGFLEFLKGLGVNVNYKEKLTTKDYQKILLRAENLSSYSIINRVMLRSMQKAKYHPNPEWHFGLGETFYCHFTSPIRRYPDLFVHRVLKDCLRYGQTFVYKKYQSILSSVCANSSQAERNAMEAERAIDDYYKILYISDYVGNSFEGVVSGVTSFGLFVELPNGIEGFVKMETLKGKYFTYDAKNYLLSDGKTKYKLGQLVKVTVAGVDVVGRRADFLIVN